MNLLVKPRFAPSGDPFASFVTVLAPLSGTLDDIAGGRVFSRIAGSSDQFAADGIAGATHSLVGPSKYELVTGADTVFTDDFTVEMYVKSVGGVSSDETSPFVSMGLSGAKVELAQYDGLGGGPDQWGSSPPDDRLVGTLAGWSHLCVTRSQADVRFFRDGLQAWQGTNALQLGGASLFLYQRQGSALSYTTDQRRICWLRVTKGIARYTSTFIPPTTFSI